MNVNIVEVQGLEPRIKEPKSSVLPLHHTSEKKLCHFSLAHTCGIEFGVAEALYLRTSRWTFKN